MTIVVITEGTGLVEIEAIDPVAEAIIEETPAAGVEVEVLEGPITVVEKTAGTVIGGQTIDLVIAVAAEGVDDNLKALDFVRITLEWLATSSYNEIKTYDYGLRTKSNLFRHL